MPPTIESFLSEKLALNAPSTGGPPYNVPSEIPLMPTDALLRGRDGRTYLLPDAAAVINASVLPVAVDCEHGSASPYTSASGRAVGRVTSMRQRAGIVWGRMEWTADGRVKVAAGEYLYVSPGFLLKHDYESDAPPEVMQILSAGLVNLANLEMPALNSARRQPERTPAMAKQPMIFLSDREKAFCSSAGLDAGAFLENKLRKAGVLTLQPAANALNAASQPDASSPAPNAAAVELQERCRAHDRLQSLQEAELTR